MTCPMSNRQIYARGHWSDKVDLCRWNGKATLAYRALGKAVRDDLRSLVQGHKKKKKGRDICRRKYFDIDSSPTNTKTFMVKLIVITSSNFLEGHALIQSIQRLDVKM